MRSFVLFIGIALLSSCMLKAQTSRQAAQKPASATTPGDQIQTETIKVPESMQAPPKSMANQPGYMEPTQTHQLLTKLWQAEERVKDLANQIHPEQMKMSPGVTASFNGHLDMLRRSLDSLEKSRAMFDSRVDSDYLGFETYAAISEVLPTLERLTVIVSRYNNPSLEGELNQAWNDMLTMRQSLKPYLTFLLRNHDKIFATMEMNLAGCQNELGYKNYNSNGPTKYMRNVLPNFNGRPVRKKTETTSPGTKSKP
jgi:hypothetical protein